MPSFEDTLNTLLTKIYRSIEVLEEEMLHSSHGMDLNINEIHMLEAVAESGKDSTATISKISDYLEISLPSVTAAINKLVRKGFVEKAKSPTDGRVVEVSFTRAGRRLERAHRYFHRNMVRSLAQELTAEDRNALVRGIGKLDDFLDRNIKKYREQT